MANHLDSPTMNAYHIDANEDNENDEQCKTQWTKNDIGIVEIGDIVFE